MYDRHTYIHHVADAMLSPSNRYCVKFKVNSYQNNYNTTRQLLVAAGFRSIFRLVMND